MSTQACLPPVVSQSFLRPAVTCTCHGAEFSTLISCWIMVLHITIPSSCSPTSGEALPDQLGSGPASGRDQEGGVWGPPQA